MDTQKKYADNAALLQKSLGGDKTATEKLVINNAGLVRGIAMRFVGRGTDLEDLLQIGNMGLIKAIRTFDPGRECAFSTYAVPLIFGEIRRHLRDDGLIKVSRTQKRLAAVLAEEREKAAKAGENLRIEELAKRAGVSVGEAVSAMESALPVRSLTEPVWGEDEGVTLDAVLTDEDEGERTFDKLALSMSIDKLPPLQRRIILLRYYRDLSQQETADILGLTQVKISREEKKCLTFLRRELS